MRDETVPVFLIEGFLESGKTTFLKFTLEQEYFQIDGKTLLIVCEQGEEEYDPKALARVNTVIEYLETEEELTTAALNTFQLIHQPERVVIEYNGMWLASHFEELPLPKGWSVEQRIVCVDASTFQIYVQNMKSIIMDMMRKADMVVFNRSNASMPLASFRRSIKAANQGAEVIFENENGEISDIFADELPFDVNADVIDILPEDYGIWFIDATDHPQTYEGKKVHFQARVMKSRLPGAKSFVPGRMAMTCCAADTSFLGYICRSKEAGTLKQNQWIDLTATVKIENRPEYRFEAGPVLEAEVILPCEPLKNEMVYFN